MPDPRDQLQQELGNSYTLERELGRGGMAIVWLAHDQKHKRLVALKVLHPDLAASLGSERFRREIEMAAGLQHPHILSVHDSGESGGNFWFTMPYVEGESLRQRLTRDRQLPVDEAIRIAREAAQALQYAHERGVVHRDIKPENLLLTNDGITLVADFGIARALGGGASGGAQQRLTETGLVMGTPQYMSPEQATGERALDARTDVYSLGAVLYEMLAGEPPFTGPTAQTVIAKMLSGEAPSVRRARPAVPEAVDAAIRKALAPAPADRFASAAEFGRALAGAETTTRVAPTSTPLVSGGTTRPRVPTGFALLVLGVLLGGGVLFAWRRTQSHSAGAEGGQATLAVLPFENEGDTSSAYFADGITDEIRGKLTALPSLHVIARASSNQYRHTGKSPEQIARELGASYLLTGTVRWASGPGNVRRVRVSPELVQVGEGSAPQTRWQQSFDTTLADVFQVQTAVASRVADKLGVVLSPPAQEQLAQRPTDNLAAYDAYLRSLTFEGGDPPTIRRALAAAEQAVSLDSNFAAAWARVSLMHSALYSNSVPTRTDADASKRAAERAIALAPKAPEGYVARAFQSRLVLGYEGSARKDFLEALRLAPSSAEVLRSLAQSEAAAGEWDAAMTHFRKAAELDPRSALVGDRLSRALNFTRRYPEARAEAERALAINATNLPLIEDRAMSYLGEGDLAGARASLRAVSVEVERPALIAYIANYWDLYWMLDSADRAVAIQLPASSYDGDTATSTMIRAQLYWLINDTARARVNADSARRYIEPQLKAIPNDWQRHLFHALTLAYLGRRAEADKEAEHGLALARAIGDQWSATPYAMHLSARIQVAAGNKDRAVALLDSLLGKAHYISPQWLRIDPTWDPLRNHPGFQKLAASR